MSMIDALVKQSIAVVDHNSVKRITPSGKTVYRVEIAGRDITLRKHSNNNFTVVYHKKVCEGLTYADAAHELGECIMHALACEGKLD